MDFAKNMWKTNQFEDKQRLKTLLSKRSALRGEDFSVELKSQYDIEIAALRARLTANKCMLGFSA
jgi:hypothetical protein